MPPDRAVGQILLVDSLQVAKDGLGAKRHGAIDPDADFGGPEPTDVSTEAGRNLDGRRDVAFLEAVPQIAGIGNRRALFEVCRAPNLREVGPALVGVVAIENGESQRIDVGRYTVAEDEHEERGAAQGETQADRIAQELEGLPDGAGDHASRAERVRRFATGGPCNRDVELQAGRRRAPGGLFEIVDECLFETGGPAPVDELGRRSRRKHASGIHQ